MREGLIEKLSAALDVPMETVHEAVAETKRKMWEAEDAAWRPGSFRMP